jgi:hypothetical protein
MKKLIAIFTLAAFALVPSLPADEGKCPDKDKAGDKGRCPAGKKSCPKEGAGDKGAPSDKAPEKAPEKTPEK